MAWKSKEQRDAYQKRYARENKDRIAAKARAHYLKNREAYLVRAKERLANRTFDETRSDRERAYLCKIKLQFGLSAQEYRDLLTKQGGVCAICKRPERRIIKGKVARLALDHCHVTGRVRGLLCFTCNAMLGGVEDDPSILMAAIEYLKARSDSLKAG